MSHYRIGSQGEEIRHIQQRLCSLGIYQGSIDGVFGAATRTAVATFQQRQGLPFDGVVGPRTWRRLFTADHQPAHIAFTPLDHRCLALTGSFETGATPPDCFAGLAGDFDGQGLSFGVCQWNFGQESLQPLLQRMCADHPELSRQLFAERLDQLLTVLSARKSKQLAFARSIQDPVKKTINEPWRGMFKALGRTAEFQQIEAAAANASYREALQLCTGYGLWSERAVALMFDIKVQNGSIGTAVKESILADFRRLPPALTDEEREVAKLRIVANRRAEAANAAWIEDVRARKLCIANGSGAVHGITYDLQERFGIGLQWVTV